LIGNSLCLGFNRIVTNQQKMARTRNTARQVTKAAEKTAQEFATRLKAGKVICNRCFTVIREETVIAHQDPCKQRRKAMKTWVKEENKRMSESYQSFRKKLNVGTQMDDGLLLQEMKSEESEESEEGEETECEAPQAEGKASTEIVVHSCAALHQLWTLYAGTEAEGLNPLEMISSEDINLMEEIRESSK
jgi:hypothetical protein